MTWFVGTIIIFFVMVLFLTASSLGSGKKKISPGWDEITFEKYEGNLKSERVLFNLLNTWIKIDNEEKSLRDWLLEIGEIDDSKKIILKEAIRNEIKNNLDISLNQECYVFAGFSGTENDLNIEINERDFKLKNPLWDAFDKNSIRLGGNFYENNDLMGMKNVESVNDRLLKKSAKIILVKGSLSENIILIKFYIGGC
jgi:hypothetical protein